jgi:hypothetical protein
MLDIKNIFRKNKFVKDELQVYKPAKKVNPPNLIKVTTAWVGLEQIIEDILKRFDIGRDNCIEFGVEFGYSSVVFSNYFKQVTGVDTFEGDVHTINKLEHFEATSQRLSPYPNIKLIKSDYKDWIANDESLYNFAHVDIVHNYEETFECGLWAAQHSQCAIFHDTESFPEVRRAVKDIAKATGKQIYNYPYNHGLGIIVGNTK